MWVASYNDGEFNLTVHLEQKLKPREVFQLFNDAGHMNGWEKKYLTWKSYKPGKVYTNKPYQPMLHLSTMSVRHTFLFEKQLTPEATDKFLKEKFRCLNIAGCAINWTLETVNRSVDYEVHP